MIINKLSIIQGDITQQNVDAIVNAANTTLLGGGGVDGAIHKAAGTELLKECRALNGCLTGEAKLTKGYKLPAKYVIHTVGPVWNGGNNDEDILLKKAYHNSLKVAEEKGIRSLAFPCISTGVYHFPLERATKIAVNTVKDFLKNSSILEKVVFVCFDDNTYNTYNKIIKKAYI